MLKHQPTPRPFWQHLSIGTLLLGLGWTLSFFDVRIVAASDPADWPGDLRRIFKLSEIFAHGFGVAVIIVAIWNLSPMKRRLIPRLIACAAFPPLTAHLIKLFVARHRPTCFLDRQLVPTWPETSAETWIGVGQQVALNTEYASQSFPSAHAALVCGLAIGLSFLFPRGRWLFLTLSIIAAMQRVIFLAHWPSDVAIGAALGFLIAGGLVQNWGIGWLCGNFESRASVRFEA